MNSQGYAILRLKWPDFVEWSFYRGRLTYHDKSEARGTWRKLINLCKHLRPRMDYHVTYYLTIPIPLAVVEWPGRWMKSRQRAVKISTWVGTYPSLSSKGMASYEVVDSWEGR